MPNPSKHPAQSRPHRADISLTTIYQALQKPKSSIANTTCRAQLHNATTKEIDYTLRKLLSYAKSNNSTWPPKRLLRCLDYIFANGIKTSSGHKIDILKLSSFRSSIRWTLEMIKNTEILSERAGEGQQDVLELSIQIQTAIKFLCMVMESFPSSSNSSSKETSDESSAIPRILQEVRHRKGVQSLLGWSKSNVQHINVYSVRALTAQTQFFAQDLIKLDAYTVLSGLLEGMPTLLTALSLRPLVTDAAQKKSELEQNIMICRLLESVFRYEPQDLSARIAFAESGMFEKLVKVWGAVCQFDCQDVHTSKSPTVKNQRLLVYSLCTVVQKCLNSSKEKAGNWIAETKSIARWQPLTARLMQRFVHGTCCTTNSQPSSSSVLSSEKAILKRLIQISLDIVPVLRNHGYWLDYVDQLVCDLTNFLMAFVSQPILPEQADMIGGSDLTLLHTHICIDVEERGYTLDGTILNEHGDLLLLLLEAFIQHIQISSPTFIQMISGRIAWCLKSMATILLSAEQLETSILRTRLLKLIVFFLHYDDAIVTLAASTTNISPFVWGSTIEFAKQGLLTAISLSPSREVTQQEASIIYKAKRAFMSLEKISAHPRACERLLDNNVLQLVDVSFIPPGSVMENTVSLLAVYALFGQFIAALSQRTAFVRTRLRDECELLPMIMKLLNEAVKYKETRRNKVTSDNEEKTLLKDKSTTDPVLTGWNHVISGCMMVILSFQYDEQSMKMWLSWKNTRSLDDQHAQTDKMEDVVNTKDEPAINNQNKTKHIDVLVSTSPTSILPALLCVLFPWRNIKGKETTSFEEINGFLKADIAVISLAAQLLDQLSFLPLCGRQMVMDQTALSNLCRLTICLTADSAENEYMLAPKFTAFVNNTLHRSTEHTTHNAILIDKTMPDALTANEEDEKMEQEDMEEQNNRYLSSTSQSTRRTLRTKMQKMRQPAHFVFAGYLRRSAIRILTSHENIQSTLSSDAFTSFFGPSLQHPGFKSSHKYWQNVICDDLYEKKLHDFESLYRFTEFPENAIKLHEMTAVAIGYSAIGSPQCEDWNRTLGLTTLELDVVNTKYAFGTFCQMLVYELEYEEDQEKDQEKTSTDLDSLLTIITPFRRNAAAQVIESLAMELELIWQAETESIIEITFFPDYISLLEPPEIVTFVTDEQPENPISGNRQLLRARSPIFEALLSADYAESMLTAIPLHDVTFHALKLFILAVHQINDNVSIDHEDILSASTEWEDVIELLQISDRFGSTVVKALCEHWILRKVKSMIRDRSSRRVCLEGMLHLYRHCRDPIERDGGITSDTWPFSTILKECLKAVAQYLSESCQTKEFTNMVADKDDEELSAFCNGLAFLLRK